MNPNTLMQDLKQLRSTVRLQGAALALMGACLLCSLVLMFNMVGRDRVVVTPPSIDKTFWVSKDRVSSATGPRQTLVLLARWMAQTPTGGSSASCTPVLAAERCRHNRFLQLLHKVAVVIP